MKTFKQFLGEIYGRSAQHAGRGISQRISTIVDDDENDPEYHRQEAESLRKAIEANPDWASSMLPKMKARLAHHEKRVAELSK